MTMRVLIIDEDTESREATGAALRSPDRAISLAESATLETLAASPADVVVLRWPSFGGPELVRSICAADHASKAYLLVQVPANDCARAMQSALGAGAHDVVRDDSSPEELRARVDVHVRMQRWATAHAAAAQVPSPLHRLRSWSYLGAVVADDLEALFGQRARVGVCAVARPAGRSAGLALSLPLEKFELRISITVPDEALVRLGASLIRSATPTPALLADLVREMVNTAGGAIKRSALPEGITFTSTLPKDEAEPVTMGPCARAWSLEFAEGATVYVVAEIRRRENERVPPKELKEGMVVVQDMFGKGGMLLVRGGTCLTLTTAQKLATVLDPRSLIEVVEAA